MDFGLKIRWKQSFDPFYKKEASEKDGGWHASSSDIWVYSPFVVEDTKQKAYHVKCRYRRADGTITDNKADNKAESPHPDKVQLAQNETVYPYNYWLANELESIDLCQF